MTKESSLALDKLLCLGESPINNTKEAPCNGAYILVSLLKQDERGTDMTETREEYIVLEAKTIA